MTTEREWWRGAIVYQIYPRSFCDGNDDGVGDLPGITARLDYVARLGVDCVWLSPFYASPMKDGGYDISDHRAIAPIFGTSADFDRLIARAHELGLKVMIDQVYSHTSDEHPWFRESRSSRDNPKASWYVWADAKPDGSPPNNWLSVFGGPAWQWDSRRRQYYLHNFLACQPDLNFHWPEVRAEVLDLARFWLRRSVDGLRLDVSNFYYHDRLLRDNPPRGPSARVDRTAVSSVNPYSYQFHLQDKTQPENLAFLRKLRSVLDGFPSVASIGEIDDDDPLGVMASYTSGDDKLHMAYAFELLSDAFSAAHIRRTVETLEARIGDGWPCWSLGNHDVPRVLSRWGGPHAPAALGKLLFALVCSLRGSVCIYQGEELALDEAEIPFDELRDPPGITFWPEYKGRDGCRTPMPWTALGRFAGFSNAEPWLPIAPSHRERAVDVQETSDGSVLRFCRRFLAWRRRHPALRMGTIRFCDSPDETLVLLREHEAECIVGVFNLSRQPKTVPLPPQTQPLEGHGFSSQLSPATVDLPSYGAFYGRIGGTTVAL